MKNLSRRTLDLAQSDIRAISALVQSVNGINLGQGICDMPVPDLIKTGAHLAIDSDKSTYTNFAGIDRLRQSILRKARSYNGLPAESIDEVLVSAGSTGAFVAAIFALLDPGDEAVLFEPFYGYHRSLLGLTGANVRCVPTKANTWDPDLDALRSVITPQTKLVVLCTPGNPSGKVWRREELQELLGILEEHDLWAVTDEIYEYMLYDGCKHVSLAALPEAYDRTITISGFSKTYNMTGWRLGYAVGPKDIMGKMGLLNDLFYVCAPSPLQHAVARAFEMDDSYFDALHRDYTKKRQRMCETLEACGFGVSWPEGSYYVMADVRPLSQLRSGFEDDATACKTLIEEAGVASVPGNSFFENPENGRPFLRFCYAKEFRVLNEACQRLLDTFAT
jgi:aminotransferase